MCEGITVFLLILMPYWQFEKIELKTGEIVRAINIEFDKLKDGTFINIYCLKDC